VGFVLLPSLITPFPQPRTQTPPIVSWRDGLGYVGFRLAGRPDTCQHSERLTCSFQNWRQRERLSFYGSRRSRDGSCCHCKTHIASMFPYSRKGMPSRDCRFREQRRAAIQIQMPIQMQMHRDCYSHLHRCFQSCFQSRPLPVGQLNIVQ